MKFCPECGAVIADKDICDCGYNKITGEVDQKIREEMEKQSKNTQTAPNLYEKYGYIVDEMHKSPEMVKSLETYAQKIQLVDNISKYLKGVPLDLEEYVIAQYQECGLKKEDFSNLIKELLDLKMEEHLKKCLDKLPNKGE